MSFLRARVRLNFGQFYGNSREEELTRIFSQYCQVVLMKMMLLTTINTVDNEERYEGNIGRHPYIEENINCRLFTTAEQLIQTDGKFIAFYKMSNDVPNEFNVIYLIIRELYFNYSYDYYNELFII